MEHPATKKRGGDPDVKHTPPTKSRTTPWSGSWSRGWRRSMAGSDPVSITQPSKSKVDKQRHDKEHKGALH